VVEIKGTLHSSQFPATLKGISAKKKAINFKSTSQNNGKREREWQLL